MTHSLINLIKSRLINQSSGMLSPSIRPKIACAAFRPRKQLSSHGLSQTPLSPLKSLSTPEPQISPAPSMSSSPSRKRQRRGGKRVGSGRMEEGRDAAHGHLQGRRGSGPGRPEQRVASGAPPPLCHISFTTLPVKSSILTPHF